MAREVRVRYAPSPTGHLHIGNARTALFNYLFARSQNGKLIVRIEDTDLKRNVEGGVENQLEFMEWLGLDWDESVDKPGEYGPYRQTERIALYEKYTNELMEKGLAYKCYCTEEELEAEREAQIARGEMPRYSGQHRNLSQEQMEQFEAEGRKPSIRFRVPADKEYAFQDIVKGELSFNSNDFGDFVIVKKDGIPTYNFAVVIDDYTMNISHVLRGDDHVSNTPRQLMIYEALGFEAPLFGHMTLIVNEQRKKLSKRDESIIQFIEQYRDLGFLPEALFNFIAFLGWSPEGEDEIFSKEQLVDIFDANRLSKSPAVFDTDKLHWLNNHYIKHAELERIVHLCIPHMQEAGYLFDDIDEDTYDWVTQLVSLYQEQLRYAAEIVPLSALFFHQHLDYDKEAEEVLQQPHVAEVLQSFIEQLSSLETFDPASIKQCIKSVQKATGHKGKNLFMPIRIAASGQTHGPDLNQTLYLLGKKTVISRLQTLINA
ncbi:glutamate--tRNA ligase [Longirhabdus pacifica]|uniref:glutamate--tRNA ligase n=1 Tax=Longirhabdus pacifica TaxID=2305227 RepID=UPI0010088BF7|nr:glutamate--tRNA ligase [Longirhabdus pacifica]